MPQVEGSLENCIELKGDYVEESTKILSKNIVFLPFSKDLLTRGSLKLNTKLITSKLTKILNIPTNKKDLEVEDPVCMPNFCKLGKGF